MAADLALRAGGVLVLALLALPLLRGASPAARSRVCALALIAALGMPLAMRALPEWRVPVLPARAAVEAAASEPIAAGEDRELDDAAALAGLRSEASPTERSASARGGADWRASMILVWALVALVLLARALYRWRGLRGLGRRVRAVRSRAWTGLLDELRRELGIRRDVRLFSVAGPVSPAACGILRPAVVLPRDAARWRGGGVRCVLLHELAHLRRRDPLLRLAADLACALYWFLPPVWILARRLRRESELACDALVIDRGARPSGYAHVLLTLRRLLTQDRRGSTAAQAALLDRSDFEARLAAILDPGRRSRTGSGMGASAGLLAAAALFVPVATLRPVPGQEAERPAAPAPEPVVVEVIDEPQPDGSSRLSRPGALEAIVRAALERELGASPEIGRIELRPLEPGEIDLEELVGIDPRRAKVEVGVVVIGQPREDEPRETEPTRKAKPAPAPVERKLSGPSARRDGGRPVVEARSTPPKPEVVEPAEPPTLSRHEMGLRRFALRACERYDAYVPATCSFEHATVDDVRTTRNDWDLLLRGRRSPYTFDVCTVTDDRSGILDLGPVPLESVRLGPRLEREVGEERAGVHVGHSYLIHTRDRGTDLSTRIRVIDLDPEGICTIAWEILRDDSPRPLRIPRRSQKK